MSKEILITSQGMIGRYLDSELSGRGFDVEVTTSKEERSSVRDGIHYLEATDFDSVRRIVSGGWDAIINMMGVADPRKAANNPDITDKVNHQSVIQMLEAIKSLPESKRPVVILACSVLQFDIKESGHIFPDHPLKTTQDPYIDSKNKMFLGALPYLKDGLDIRFAFLGNTTGENHQLGYFPPDIADQIVRGEKNIKHGPVDHKRPILHGKDSAKMIYYALTHLSSGSRFMVTGKESVKLEDFMNKMIEVSKKQDVGTVQVSDFGAPTPIKDLTFDISEIERFKYQQIHGVPDICRTLLSDRYRILKGIKQKPRGVYGY